jgi:chromosome segregation ATPase
VDDLMERIVEKFAGVAEDVRVFAPMVREHDEMRAEMRFVRESVTTLLASHAALEKRIEQEREERRAGQAERKQEMEDAIAARDLEMRKLEEREREREERRQQQHQDLRKFYIQLMAGLATIFLTSLGGVVVAWITSRGGMK